jgi:cephalosporin hydroxylase
MFHRITLIEGSSIDNRIVSQVKSLAESRSPIMVLLDSNHTHNHVANELRMYAPLVTIGSYLVVFDTIIEHLPADAVAKRPWGKGNNPMTAVEEFLKTSTGFAVDETIHNKLLATVAPEGYLKRIS